MLALFFVEFRDEL